MVHNDLLGLPAAVLASIFTEWLGRSCLPRLDIALCNRTSRQLYFDILGYAGTVYDSFVCKHHSKMSLLFDWLTKRPVRIRKIYISSHGRINKTMASKFWGSMGSSFEFAAFELMTKAQHSFLKQAAAQRKTIKRLQVDTAEVAYRVSIAPYLRACGFTQDRSDTEDVKKASGDDRGSRSWWRWG
jgi:hypothetical protein